MNKQLEGWEGSVGDRYWRRHSLYRDMPSSRLVRLNAPMKAASMPRRILEVGCGNGVNLLALKSMLGSVPPMCIKGIEPNRQAAAAGQKAGADITIGNAFALPFDDNSFDMVFTMGVLIHMADKEVTLAVKEMYRVASKYLLVAEYFAQEAAVESREGIPWCWARPYQQVIQGIVDVALCAKGPLHRVEVSKRDSRWWLFNVVPSAKG